MTLDEKRELQRRVAGAMAHLDNGRTQHAWRELERAWLMLLLEIDRDLGGVRRPENGQ